MSNANSNKRPKINTIPVSTEGIDELFRQPEIAAKYQNIRESEEVEKYYLEMIDNVIKSCTDTFFKSFIKGTRMKEHNEVLIQESILAKAIEKLIKEGAGDFHDAIMSVLTMETFIEEIDILKIVLQESIRDIEKAEKMIEVLKFCFD